MLLSHVAKQQGHNAEDISRMQRGFKIFSLFEETIEAAVDR